MIFYFNKGKIYLFLIILPIFLLSLASAELPSLKPVSISGLNITNVNQFFNVTGGMNYTNICMLNSSNPIGNVYFTSNGQEVGVSGKDRFNFNPSSGTTGRGETLKYGSTVFVDPISIGTGFEPNYYLDVKGSSYFDQGTMVIDNTYATNWDDGYGNGLTLYACNYYSNYAGCINDFGSANYIVLDPGGTLGVLVGSTGGYFSGAKLQVAGDIWFSGVLNANGNSGTSSSYTDGVNTAIQFNGGIATSISTAFDQKLMKNVTYLGDSTQGLTPISFQWNNLGLAQFINQSENTGLIIGYYKAQDVQIYYPQCVLTTKEKNGTYIYNELNKVLNKTVSKTGYTYDNYLTYNRNCVSTLIIKDKDNTIKQLQDQITELQTQTATIESDLAVLSNTIKAGGTLV